MSALGRLGRRLAAIDLDEVFSYNTVKEVRMLDRRLGIVCWVIRTMVLAYVIGYVFVMREGYAETEKGFGHAVSQVEGMAFSMANGKARPWDTVDAAQPALENGAAFIGTTIYVTSDQKIANCSNPAAQCATNADCKANPPLEAGRCVSGMCIEMQWCPAHSDANLPTTTKHELKGVKDFKVWVRGAITFPALDAAKVFSTISDGTGSPYAGGAGPGAVVVANSTTMTLLGAGGSGGLAAPDLFTVEELLSLAGTTYETVAATGATIAVSLLWSCFVDSPKPCVPSVQVQRMDVSERRRGFSYQYANYYRDAAGTEKRDLNTVMGVRLLLSSRGEGKKVSLGAIMLQISSGIALLWLANFAADFLMIYVLPERKHYRTYKQVRAAAEVALGPQPSLTHSLPSPSIAGAHARLLRPAQQDRRGGGREEEAARPQEPLRGEAGR